MSSAQLTPDQAKFVLAMALPTLKSEHQTTKRVIEAIPWTKATTAPTLSRRAPWSWRGTSWQRRSAS